MPLIFSNSAAQPHAPVAPRPSNSQLWRCRHRGLRFRILAATLLASSFLSAAASAQNTAALPFALQPTSDLSSLSSEQLQQRVKADPASLGSLSLGFPHNGQLLNPVQPDSGRLFEVVAPDFCYGTQETVDYLKIAVEEVLREHPSTPPLHLGHISKPGGGYLSPHLSHQSGRDVDLGYYYKKKRTWYRRATNDTLDVERTWTLIRAFITKTDVEFLFIDRWVQILLKNYAKKIGEDKEWLHRVFVGSKDRPAIIRHARGHATHIHARFFNPKAQENARIAYPHLLAANIIEPVVVYVHHKVRKGETLGRLAKRYDTTVKAIQRANGLRGTTIQARRTYKIPRKGGPAQVGKSFELPPRVLPPPPTES